MISPLNLAIWGETVAVLALTITINAFVLAPLTWSTLRGGTVVASASLALTCLLVLVLPFLLVSATSHLHALPSACGALMCYVAVWKVYDSVRGTANEWVRITPRRLAIHMGKQAESAPPRRRYPGPNNAQSLVRRRLAISPSETLPFILAPRTHFPGSPVEFTIPADDESMRDELGAHVARLGVHTLRTSILLSVYEAAGEDHWGCHWALISYCEGR